MVISGIIFADAAYDLTNERTYIDTIGATDSVKITYQLATARIEGSYSWQYYVRNIAGDTKLYIYTAISNDGKTYFNRTIIDTVAADDSVMILNAFNPVKYWQIILIGYGVDGDTIQYEDYIKPALK